MEYIENKTFDEISVGDTAELVRTLTSQDIDLFAVMSGDVNPAHVDEEFAKTDMFHEVIAHGMWGGALISAVLGTELPGPGTIYLKQSLNFRKPVGIGDTVTVKLTVKEKNTTKKRLIFSCICKNQENQTVIEGLAEVVAPTEKIRRPRVVLPEVLMHERGVRYQELFRATKGIEPIRTAVVHPCDRLSLESALEAGNQGMIKPILIGPIGRIKQLAADYGLSLQNISVIDVAHSQAAAQCALQLVRDNEADAIMKGALQTDKLMAEVVKRDSGLRTENLMSHVYVLDVPHYHKLLLITDAEINISPDLQGKREIIQNSINLAHAIGITQPKVAILSALEDIAPKIPSTIDAAALCKMAERGQLSGALVDGPLSFDLAISKEAAESKDIRSDIAGDVDILVAPDIEAGAMIAQQLAGAEAAGIVLGASVPIMLSSRADSTMARLASCALAQLLFYRKTTINVD